MVVVKDEIPEGTTYVEGSIKVNEADLGYTLEDLAQGINVGVAEYGTSTVTFKVRVNNIENGTEIRNTATVNEVPTETTENTYVEPVISVSKKAELSSGLAYVTKGDRITYRIKVKNSHRFK